MSNSPLGSRPDTEPGATLLLALWIPDADRTLIDPEQMAEEMSDIINDERDRNGGSAAHVEVSAIPPPQWVTAESLESLRGQARS